MKEITKERTITEKYTLYEAFDGQEFADKKECQKYEESALEESFRVLLSAKVMMLGL